MTSARLAAWADAACFALLALALAVELTGGIRVEDGWFRFSMTNPSKLVVWSLGLCIVRHLAIRHPSLRERLAARRSVRWPDGGPWQRLAPPPLRESLAAALILVLVTSWMLRDQLRMPTGVPDYGDPLFSMWRLYAVAHNLATDPWHLFDGNIFHPMRDTLALSDAVVLPGAIALPFLAAGVPVAVAYGALIVTSFWAAGMAMFWLARAVTRDFMPALFAAVLFAFYPFRFSGYAHIEKHGAFLMPVALYLVLRLLQTGRARDGLLLGVAIALQLLWSIYIGMFLAMALAVLIIAMWIGGHFRWRDRVAALLVAALIVLAVGGVYTRPYWRARTIVGERPLVEVHMFSATPQDLLSITKWNRLYGPYLATSAYPERDLFPGLSASVLSFAALLPASAPPLGPIAAALVFAVDGALGVNGVTFAWLYEHVPAFRAFRAPGRFSLVAGLFVALLAAAGFARWFGRESSRHRRLIGGVVIGFVVFELQPVLLLHPVSTTAPPIYDALPDDGNAVVADLPIPDRGYGAADFLNIYASTFHGRRLINGVSGFLPPAYVQLAEDTSRFPGDIALDALRRRGVEYVVLHEAFYGTDRYRNVIQSIELRGNLVFLAARPSPYGGEDRLYRVQ